MSHAISFQPTESGTLLTCEVRIERPCEEVFEFFANAHNLERITPPFLHFDVCSPAPIEMRCGTLIDYRLSLRGVPMRWQSEITEWNPPHSFTDTQRRGPYRRWEHRHLFEDLGAATVVRDEVHYRVPGGRIVDRLFVQRELAAIFTFRVAALLEAFASSGEDIEQRSTESS
jgi:ligand-binding SRPBCC domain-containing protein